MFVTPPPRPLPSIVWPLRSSVMLPVPMTRALSGQSMRSFMTLTLSSSTSPHETSRATGAGRTRQVWATSTSPLGLIARSLKVWLPTASGPGYSFGEPHPANAEPSSEHSNLVPDASATNSNVAYVSTVVGSGADVMLTSGGATVGGSTHHSYFAGVRSTFPAASTARTANEWLPTASVRDAGVEHGPHAASSTEPWNVTDGLALSLPPSTLWRRCEPSLAQMPQPPLSLATFALTTWLTLVMEMP